MPLLKRFLSFFFSESLYWLAKPRLFQQKQYPCRRCAIEDDRLVFEKVLPNDARWLFPEKINKFLYRVGWEDKRRGGLFVVDNIEPVIAKVHLMLIITAYDSKFLLTVGLNQSMVQAITVFVKIGAGFIK